MRSKQHFLFALLVTVLVAFTAASTLAGSAKVEVCHVPPGDPSNFHTITISQNALPGHLAHGDQQEACNARCAAVCDDGNACTIDDFGDCEQEGCPALRLPVDCDDNSLCTDDSCNADIGCVNAAIITCADTDDLCIGNSCNPATGECDIPFAKTVCPSNDLCRDYVCVEGLCVITTKLTCDDDDLCTDPTPGSTSLGTCSPLLGCLDWPACFSMTCDLKDGILVCASGEVDEPDSL